MPGSVEPYLALITDQHRDKPDFIATLRAVLQPLADGIAVMGRMPRLYDLDEAVGVQLDAVGEWIGRPRQLSRALEGVYFSLGDPELGFGQGTWKGPYDPATGLVSLPDDPYRTLLRATIAANQWDGTIPGAYAIWDMVFEKATDITFEGSGPITFLGSGEITFRGGTSPILIQDQGDMTMLFAVMGQQPDAVTMGLLTGGYIALKPAGVRIDAYVTPTEPAPYFGFGLNNLSIAGFGAGAWGDFQASN